jgi:hypothetical protein
VCAGIGQHNLSLHCVCGQFVLRGVLDSMIGLFRRCSAYGDVAPVMIRLSGILCGCVTFLVVHVMLVWRVDA